ncbi:MAG: VWA domain-containing protein [Deltaproteobacteria bacterium]|nr:VWA domain-containing protein [Deltaproteobacteria bacterium]
MARKRSLLSVLGPLAVIVFIAVGAGCSAASMDAASGAPPGSMGATPGGAQDAGLFRAKIARGEVPRSDELHVEGMLAEHDLPVLGEPCTRALCLGSATAIAAGADDGDRTAWVQLGFSTGFDAATFKRPDLDLSVVVDRSGSMAGEKIVAARDAVRKLVGQLGPRDRLSIVLFDDKVDVLVSPTFVDDTNKERILGQIVGIEARGATNIELGLSKGYAFTEQDVASTARSHRVMLLTDALPNIGSTDAGSFIGMARTYAAKGIGLTAFGIGLDFGQQLAHDISQVRGGAYFFLQDEEKLRTVFDRDFDYLVTPIAYDMKVSVGAQTSWTFSTAYGVPSASLTDGRLALNVPTVFLSRNKGAIVLRYAPKSTTPEAPVAHLAIDYQKVDGTPVHQELDATYGGKAPLTDGFEWYQQVGVRKVVALSNWVLGVKKALQARESGDPAEAKKRIGETRAAFAAHVTELGDEGLKTELLLLDRLIALM